MSIVQLEKTTKLCSMEITTRHHEDTEEFYYSLIDTHLDNGMIALYIKSLFEISGSGINRCLQ